MVRRKILIFLFFMPLLPFFVGCSGTIHEVLTSTPPGADIYWGKTPDTLENSGRKTTSSRAVTGSEWEPWCYQLKKEGYNDSEINCRPREGYRYVDFCLEPLKTLIDSDPPGAVIYWGPTETELKETIYRTPHVEQNVRIGANWKDWYFQVKKKGYKDSEIIFVPRSPKKRQVVFKLELLERQ